MDYKINKANIKPPPKATAKVRAMGHSSINVSLTYLRGLEIPELTEEDMPVV